MTGWDGISALEPRLRRGMEFLLTHLPASDLDLYPYEMFLDFSKHAMKFWGRLKYREELEEDIFLHYVLFPRVNDEDLSFHREIFYNALAPRLEGIGSTENAVLEVNRWCAEMASYESTDERTLSPLTVFRCGSGRCGEESAFLVSALRSVGIPARQVYVPRWSHCGDNHAWVEALCGGRWRFLGACEPEPELDRGWFNSAASRAVLVHSRLFGRGSSPLHGAPIGSQGIVTYFNQTSRYADVSTRVLRARAGGRPASGAEFELSILNEGDFHPIAVLVSGPSGEVRAELGAGTVHVLARLGELFAEGELEGAELTLDLLPAPESREREAEFFFSAPPPTRAIPLPVDADEREKRALERKKCAALRQKRLDGMAALSSDLPIARDLLELSFGNAGEIHAFLGADDSGGRERLLRTLPPKDLRDTDLSVLEDHYSSLPARRGGVPEDIYWSFTACPRIGREKLTSWRGALLARGSGDMAPGELWEALGGLEEPDPRQLAPGLCWTPAEALAAGRCDGYSRALLFTAALRSAGVPARLRCGEPEYWEDGGFRPLFPRTEAELELELQCPDGGGEWSLALWDGGWRTKKAGQVLSDKVFRLTLPVGRLRLILSARLPGGDQLAFRRDFDLAPPGRAVTARFPGYPPEKLLFSRVMPEISARDVSGALVPDIFRAGRPALIIWVDEGAEPTEHLLSELAALSPEISALGPELMVLRPANGAPRGALRELLRRLPGTRLLTGDWDFDRELAARELARDPGDAPLAVLGDGAGRALYADSGYRTGAGTLLLKAAKAASKR